MFLSVAQQFSHRRAAIHGTGRLPRQWHAAADQTTQQSAAALDQQIRAWAADTWNIALIIWGLFSYGTC